MTDAQTTNALHPDHDPTWPDARRIWANNHWSIGIYRNRNNTFSPYVANRNNTISVVRYSRTSYGYDMEVPKYIKRKMVALFRRHESLTAMALQLPTQ